MYLQVFKGSALGLVALVAISTALAQVAPLVTRSVPRDQTKHVVGHAVLSPQIVTTWGGVVSQADSLVVLGEPAKDVRLTLMLDESGTDGLSVDFGDTTLFYPIDYSDLVPMALFVESGGSGLYTAFDLDVLGDGFDQRAGAIEIPVIFDFSLHRIALEFADTIFQSALSEIDFCRDCLEGAPESFRDLANSVTYEWPEIAEWPIDADNPRSSYINTDFGSDVIAVADGERLAITSTIARYRWLAKIDGKDSRNYGFDEVSLLTRPDRREIEAATNEHDELQQRREEVNLRLEALADGGLAFRLGQIAAEADNLASPFGDGRGIADTLSALAEEVRDAVDTKQATEESLAELRSVAMRKPLADGYYLIETLALLRTARKLNPDAFAQFMATLRDPGLVEARREPWVLYTQSFCRVYPGESECAGG